MRVFRRMMWWVLLPALLLSCKENQKSKESSSTHSLPSFSHVNLDDVFHAKDNKVPQQGEIEQTLDQYYQRVWERGNLWGGFIVAKGDNILYENYRGYAQANNEEPIDKHTALHVASVSKSVTAMAVLRLIEAQKLTLDQDLKTIFPKFPYTGITVKMLLNQRSGLPKYEYVIERIKPEPKELAKEYLDNEDILNLLIQYKPDLARKPDTGFMYCNTNYALLALVVEKVTKTKFPEAMKEMIFDPLEMKDSYIFQQKDTLTAAKSFYARGPSVHPYDRLDLIYGDKNLYTTPRDLLNFSKALYAENFLSKELMDAVFSPYSNERPGVNNYGFGFRMKIFDENSKLTYHNGWWHGTNSVFGHLLQSKVTIIAIGNKFSQRVYSALALSALFENFPYEAEKLKKDIAPISPANEDSAQGG